MPIYWLDVFALLAETEISALVHVPSAAQPGLSTLILKCETPQEILSCMGYTGTYLSRCQPQRQIGLHLDQQLKAEDMNSLSKPLALF